MANLVTDKNRLSALIHGSHHDPTADLLFRHGSIFFVGGNLPVYETLDTMFNSFCMEATALFCLTFGETADFYRSEEIARQIKKNFNVRLMARLELSVNAASLERIYAAGVDNLIFPLPPRVGDELPAALEAARGIFPPWGVAATIVPGDETAARTGKLIDALLKKGIMPLLQVSKASAGLESKDMEAVLEQLVTGWEEKSVPIPAYLPLISVMTPLVVSRPAGLFRGVLDRLRDKQQLAGSDLRRHLRVQHAENSLDSAGL